MAVTRIYTVTHRGSLSRRLVEATSQSQALRHVAADAYDVGVSSTKEVASLMGEGVHVEAANTPIDPTDPAGE